MKKLIFAFGLLLLTLSSFSQNSTVGGFPSYNNQSTSPSGANFGGSMSGANTPSTTPVNPSANPPVVAPMTSPQSNQSAIDTSLQQMEDVTSGVNTTKRATPPATVPQPTQTIPVSPRIEPTRPVVPSATGVGTGAPTTY